MVQQGERSVALSRRGRVRNGVFDQWSRGVEEEEEGEEVSGGRERIKDINTSQEIQRVMKMLILQSTSVVLSPCPSLAHRARNPEHIQS